MSGLHPVNFNTRTSSGAKRTGETILSGLMMIPQTFTNDNQQIRVQMTVNGIPYTVFAGLSPSAGGATNGWRAGEAVTYSLSSSSLPQRLGGTLELSSYEVITRVNKVRKMTILNNSSNGVLSVTSSDPSKVTADISGNVITITGVSDGTATITVTSAETDTYAASAKTIKVTVLEHTLYDDLTVEDVGKVIGSDGNVYNYSEMPSGVNSVAVIGYIGENTGEEEYGYTNGLAMAMENLSVNNTHVYIGYPTFIWKTSSTSGGHSYVTTSSNFASESGLQYRVEEKYTSGLYNHNTTEYPTFYYAFRNNGTAAPVYTSGWFLPSAYQWNQLMSSNGMGSFTGLRDCFSSRGGTNILTHGYWTCTEYNDGSAWHYNLGGGFFSPVNKEDGTVFVRAILAF